MLLVEVAVSKHGIDTRDSDRRRRSVSASIVCPHGPEGRRRPRLDPGEAVCPEPPRRVEDRFTSPRRRTDEERRPPPATTPRTDSTHPASSRRRCVDTPPTAERDRSKSRRIYAAVAPATEQRRSLREQMKRWGVLGTGKRATTPPRREQTKRESGERTGRLTNEWHHTGPLIQPRVRIPI